MGLLVESGVLGPRLQSPRGRFAGRRRAAKRPGQLRRRDDLDLRHRR